MLRLHALLAQEAAGELQAAVNDALTGLLPDIQATLQSEIEKVIQSAQ